MTTTTIDSRHRFRAYERRMALLTRFASGEAEPDDLSEANALRFAGLVDAFSASYAPVTVDAACSLLSYFDTADYDTTSEAYWQLVTDMLDVLKYAVPARCAVCGQLYEGRDHVSCPYSAVQPAHDVSVRVCLMMPVYFDVSLQRGECERATVLTPNVASMDELRDVVSATTDQGRTELTDRDSLLYQALKVLDRHDVNWPRPEWES